MKIWLKWVLSLSAAAVLVLAWVVCLHNDMLTSHLGWCGWLQKSVAYLGQKKEVAAEEEEEANTAENEIPVHVASVKIATLHKYIEGYGMVIPRPARAGQMAGGASIASPIAGVVAHVDCEVGKTVKAGDVLIQLDERQAKSAEDQAQAALDQAKASLAALMAPPRPDQVKIAEVGVEKAQAAAQFAQKNFDRLKQLAAQQVTSGKNLEQGAQDLASAQNDLAVSEKQLALVKATPRPEDIAQEQAKVAQAAAALATAHAQRQMMAMVAPINATVTAVSVNAGEAVDSTKTLVVLVAMDRLTVDVDIPADELPAGVQGMDVEVYRSSKATAAEDAPVVGKVAVVAPDVDPHNGGVPLSVDLPKDSGLKPGLSVRVRIIAGEHKDVMAVPHESLATNENGTSVIAVVRGDVAAQATVTPGYEENGLIEISTFSVEMENQKPGENIAMEEITAEMISKGRDVKVVTAGSFGLPQNTHVKVAE